MNRVYIAIIVVSLVGIGIMQCGRTKSSDGTLPDNVVALQPTETASVSVNATTNTATVQQRQDNGTVEITQQFIPAESTYSVTTSTTTGKTEIKFKKKGFCCVPTITGTYNGQLSLGIGVRLFYFNEFGIVSHLNWWFKDEKVSVSAGLDYRLYKIKLKNVALGISYDTCKTIKAQINIYL